MVDTPVKAVAAQAFKQIVIESDGTVDGTTIKLNGSKIKDLTSFYFNLYDSPNYENLSLSFTTTEATAKPGELNVSTYFSLSPCSANASDKTKATASSPLTLQASDVIPAIHRPPEAMADRMQKWAQLGAPTV